MIQKVGHTKTLCKSRKDSFLLVCSDLTLLKNTINTINRLKKKNLPGYKEAGNREDRTCLREPWLEVGELEKKDKEGLPESLHFFWKVWAQEKSTQSSYSMAKVTTHPSLLWTCPCLILKAPENFQFMSAHRLQAWMTWDC